jgi:hypothetical protein
MLEGERERERGREGERERERERGVLVNVRLALLQVHPFEQCDILEKYCDTENKSGLLA